MLRQAFALTGLVLIGLIGLHRSEPFEHVVEASGSRTEPRTTAEAVGGTATAAPCPRTTLPDGNVCVPVPSADKDTVDDALEDGKAEAAALP